MLKCLGCLRVRSHYRKSNKSWSMIPDKWLWLKSAHVSLVSIVLDVNVSEIYMSRYAKEHFSYKLRKQK